ncbi:MAG: hypothetical protein JSW10_01525 [Pseudomonadota bacterium]|nr:MAG: hypothetical protein JSW10_01525 [Pseudomonadota bacterium]
MSLLDDLKRQADAKNAESGEELARQAEREENYRTTLYPKMIEVFRYLSDMAEQLNFVDTAVHVSYPIKNYGTLEDLRQTEFKVKADSQKAMKEITFTFACVGDKRIAFDVHDRYNVDHLSDFLNTQHITYVCNRRRDDKFSVMGAGFRVEPQVPIRFVFRANIETGMIELNIMNFDGLNNDRFIVNPDVITSAYLDELGKYILRRESRLFRLEMTEDERQRLRERLTDDRAGEGLARRLGKAAAEKKNGRRAGTAGKAENVSGSQQAAASPPPMTQQPIEPVVEIRNEAPVQVPVSVPASAKDEAPAKAPANTPAEVRDEAPIHVPESAPAEKPEERPTVPPLNFANLPNASGSPEDLDLDLGEQAHKLEQLRGDPVRLFHKAAHTLSSVNRTALRSEERLTIAELVGGHVYPVVERVYDDYRRGENSLVEDQQRRTTLNACIKFVEQLAVSYKHAFVSDYDATVRVGEPAHARLAEWGFRILEALRTEQRLRALRYQKLHGGAWWD